MKNNKGQVLVVFVILIPIILMILGIIIDVSFSYYEKRKIENNIKNIIVTSFERNITEDEFKVVLNKNIDNVENIIVDAKDNYTSVRVVSKVDGVFSFLFTNPIKKIDVTYNGYIINEKVRIERG